MTWIISKIVGNPLVLIAIVAFSFCSGGFVAWQIQGLRITAVKQEHTAYVQELTRQEQEHRRDADKQREASAQEYLALQRRLDSEIESGEVYRRCVAAGKCGAVRVLKPTACSASIRLPSASGIDAPRSDAVPATSGPTAESCEALANDAAQTTLMLNQLQADIERQPGYR